MDIAPILVAYIMPVLTTEKYLSQAKLKKRSASLRLDHPRFAVRWVSLLAVGSVPLHHSAFGLPQFPLLVVAYIVPV
ncbi:hypothetical protein DRQ26_06820 [bacterium]|nr:MAG: hypothetical protein DRQ26_06820 [bacterium]